MTLTEKSSRNELVRLAKSLFDRGYSVGSSGNISVAIDDSILITPTNSCLGNLEPSRISKIDLAGTHVGGDPPSKEIFLHQAFYETMPAARAVVHLHSTYATAISCRSDIDPDDCIPALTPYVVMRVGRVRLLPYMRPGDPAMGQMIRDLQGQKAAVLLANHGLVLAAKDLESAVYASEELEETAKLLMLLATHPHRMLSSPQVQELVDVFGR
ncbi:MAG: aldolase [Hyphomicrobiales bacterium]|nr:MAG: aldolase [Hyphomicrobiales bacterium]